jgi:CheY-like chemotaxis protein
VVEDTGMGIQPEAQKEIFESFRQQSGQKARVYGGTGLGLAISKSLVEMMGGTISVRSRPGAGSVFEIRFRGVFEATETVVAEQSETSDIDPVLLGKGKVLVVDDLDLNRRLVKEFLQNTRIEVIEADNGQTALQAAGACTPDLILMDIRMPTMDGYQALRRLRRNPGTRHIPVIALTASGMKEEMERLERSGFDGWLVRPFTKPDLLRELHQYIYEPKTRAPAEKSRPSSAFVPVDSIPPLAEHVRDEIVGFLENELMDRWEVVSRKQHISDIEDFGCRIKALGDRYGVIYLSAYAENLLFHTASFDVENIRRALDAYPEFVAGIRK